MKILWFLFILPQFEAFTVSPVNCSKPPVLANAGQCCRNPDIVTTAPLIICKSFTGLNQGHPDDCFGKCFMNMTGIYLNGKLNLENFRNTFQEILINDPDYLLPLEEGFENCYSRLLNMKAKFTPPPPQAGECSPVSFFLFSCAFHEMATNCPTNKWIESDDCNTIHDFVLACPTSPYSTS